MMGEQINQATDQLVFFLMPKVSERCLYSQSSITLIKLYFQNIDEASIKVSVFNMSFFPW